jgi:DNA-binding IclR family transcriptional regulator
MHAGSSKALFAFTEPEFQDRILARSLQRYTERTIVDPGQVRTVLAKIRRDGFYVSRGEVSPDLVSVAAPVFGAGGAVVAQINIAAPASRMPPSRVKDAIAEVRAAASVLTGLLGGEQGR